MAFSELCLLSTTQVHKKKPLEPKTNLILNHLSKVNMQFISIAALLPLSTFNLVNSSPAPEPEAEAGNILEKRRGGLYACNAQNWDASEDCVLLHPKIGVCRKILPFVSTPASHAKFCCSPTENMPTEFIDSVSSTGPDCNVECSLFV
jgi:hypothetical protein